MTKKDIKVPNIGEFKNVEVIEVLVKKGQEIKKNELLNKEKKGEVYKKFKNIFLDGELVEVKKSD